MAPFTARSRSSASSVLTTLDGGVARGYAGIPQVERAVAVHLCPRNAATWRNRPRLPSKACKLTAALAAKAYSAAGQAASALHAMAILQVHQAKALKQVQEGSTDPGLMQELRTTTDFALRAMKVTARSFGKAMSTMVVQKRHLWLNLAEMKDVDKARFLDAPISQGGLFGDTVEGCRGRLTPLREVGVRILNYLDDWLILAQSREQLGDHRDLVLRHLSQLGLRINWEKSKLSPVQRISFLSVELDSVSMTARLTEERAQAVLNCLSSFRGRNVVPLKQFQRLLGHMASAAAVTPLGLLHMRPLQHWLHSRVPRWAWRRGTLRVGISQQCRRSLSPWTDLAFLRDGVPLEQVSRHTVFGKRRVPCVRAGLLSRCLETPAWLRPQGSHHALPRSGGEPASTALGGGRSSLSIAVSRKSIAHIRDPYPERQNLRAALCLPQRAAEREGCLQTEVGPLDSGGRRLGVPVARRAVPPGGDGSLHQECCLLPCVGARCLFGRHLQSCGLGDTEHLRKILQSPR